MYARLVTTAFVLFFLFKLQSQVIWEPVLTGPGSDVESTITISPNGVLYAAGAFYLYSSEDQGLTWVCERRISSAYRRNRHLAFLTDGTPLWNDEYQNAIRRNGKWEDLPNGGDFEVVNNTIYAPLNDKVRRSTDGGVNWEILFHFEEGEIHRYRSRDGRHYIEYEGSGLHRMAEVVIETDKKARRIRSVVVVPYDFQAFIVDSCHSLLYFSQENLEMLDANGTLSNRTFDGEDARVRHKNGRIYRKTNLEVWAMDECSNSWSQYPLGSESNIPDFEVLGRDSLLLFGNNQLLGITNLADTFFIQPVANSYYNATKYIELSTGTRYFGRGRSFEYGRSADGELFEVDFSTSGPPQFDANGRIYSNIKGISTPVDTIFYSDDHGRSWQLQAFPEEAQGYSRFHVLTPDIIIYQGYEDEEFAISLNNGNDVYNWPSGASASSGIFYSFRVFDNKIIFLGSNTRAISYFDLSTKEFYFDFYMPDAAAKIAILDEGAVMFLLNDDETIISILPFPYTNEKQVLIPSTGRAKKTTSIGNGILVLGDDKLYHVDNSGALTLIELGEIGRYFIDGVDFTLSGRWVINMSLEEKYPFYVSDLNPANKLGNLVEIKMLETDQNCASANPTSSVNWKVSLASNERNYITYGQPDGMASMRVPNGDYEINIEEPSYSTWMSCNWPSTISVKDTTSVQEIVILSHFIELCDPLLISLNAPFHRRCFNSYYYLELSNVGVEIIDAAQGELILADGMEFVETFYPYVQEDNIIKFNFANLQPGEKLRIPVRVNTSCDLNLGDIPCSVFEVKVSTPCSELSYNDSFCGEVIGSWDPNEKSAVNTKGSETKNYIKDEYVNYKIRFQNTGNDTAFTVRVEDCLDENLDLLSLESVSSSHDFSLEMEARNRQLVVLFEDILLPDSSTNEVLSHGYFEFKILPIKEVNLEDTLRNLVDIYFDFNAPIRTNEVSLWMDRGSNTNSTNSPYANVKYYPNPVDDILSIEVEGGFSKPTQLDIYHVNGRQILNKEMEGSASTISVAHLPPGLFIGQLSNATSRQAFKFIKN